MLFHVRRNGLPVLQKADVPKLIHPVIADQLIMQQLGMPCDVGRTGRHGRDAAACEGNLGGGREHQHPIRTSGRTAGFIDIGQPILTLRFVVQVMDAVCVIPDNPKIRCGGFQLRQRPNLCIAVGHAGGVGVHGIADDALYAGVGRKLLHRFQIRPIGQQGNADAFNPQHFQHFKMPVVPGNRAEEAHLGKPTPWRITGHRPVDPCPGQRVIDHVDAGAAADDHIGRLHIQQRAEQPFCFGNPGHIAVVADVGAVLTDKFIRQMQHGHRQLQLPGGRAAPCHIQMQTPLLKGMILLPKTGHLQFRHSFSLPGLGRVTEPLGISTTEPSAISPTSASALSRSGTICIFVWENSAAGSLVT